MYMAAHAHTHIYTQTHKIIKCNKNVKYVEMTAFFLRNSFLSIGNSEKQVSLHSVLGFVFQLIMSPQKTVFLFLRRSSASQMRRVYLLQSNFS